MNQNTCSSCAHFRQHYTFDQRKIFRVYCGHCTYIRPRTKKPDARSCENFIYAVPPEDQFVSKEFLSRVVLEYVRGLELLPEIEVSEELK